ncbi:MAG: tRNA (adenosine(37)-N6)-threonylcarbamoyltransferase complex dimerization subunit type 1 TsaB [Planctomycetota bacterium]|jgi:tRNA threonylcarbamoyladenosine biosynthesis protein TsaB
MAEDPLILAAETSGRTGSVAIAAGEQLLGETTFSRSMRHSSEIFPAACALLDDAQRKHKEVEHVYISVGPGSFTGLRIAVTLAKLMHLANGAKIVAVDTLDVIAPFSMPSAANSSWQRTKRVQARITTHDMRGYCRIV